MEEELRHGPGKLLMRSREAIVQIKRSILAWAYSMKPSAREIVIGGELAQPGCEDPRFLCTTAL